MPSSWELTSIREKRLLLAILQPPDLSITTEFAACLRELKLPPGSDFLKIGGLPWGPARNQAAKMALEKGYNLAFLDSDVRVQADAFLRLAETGLDIVSGLYFQRFPPHFPVVFNAGRDAAGNIIRVPVTGWKPGDIVPCDFIPSGLTIYRRRLLEVIFARFPRPFEWGVDTSAVPSESGQVPPFSEDFVCSWRARQLGFQPFCATGIVGLHETRAVIGPKWIVPLPSPDPSHGVCGVV